MIATMKKLLGLAAKADAPSTDLRLALSEAETEVVSAREALAAAETRYRDGLLSVDEAGARKLSDARSEAQFRLDRAEALVARLKERADEAAERERKQQTEALVTTAKVAMANLQATVEEDLPAMAEAIQRMMVLWATAHEAREAAVAALAIDHGEGARFMLPGIEDFRQHPGLPEELEHEEEVTLWVRDNGEPLPDQWQREVRLSSDGRGVRNPEHSSRAFYYTHKRKFMRRTVLEAIQPASVDSLPSSVNIPAIRAGETDGWKAIKGGYSPADVFAGLAALSGGGTSIDQVRAPIVKYEPVGPAFLVCPPPSERTLRLDEYAARRS